MKRKLMIIASVILILGAGICLLMADKLYGKSSYVEGCDIEIITSRFESFSNIDRCFYKINIVSDGGIGPTRYDMKALVVIDELESERLKEKYNWTWKKLVVDEDLYKGVGIEGITVWMYSEEFEMDTLGGGFVGSVYFSEEDNCILIIASV